jgi:hypothetical protein
MLVNHAEDPIFDNGVPGSERRRANRDLGEAVLTGADVGVDAYDKQSCRYANHDDFFLLPQRRLFLKNIRRARRAARLIAALILVHGRLRRR